jgi:hypothetical protein
VGAQQRQTLVSAFLIVLLFCVVVAAMPPSSLERTLSRPARPFLEATGLDQSWGVFAPNPRREVIDMSVRILYPDGRAETWRPPKGYRWRKLMEHTNLSEGLSSLARDTVLYAARSAGGRPIRAILLRRWAALPPEAGTAPGRWRVIRNVFAVEPEA